MKQLLAILVVALALFAPLSVAAANDATEAPQFHLEVPAGMDGMGDALRKDWPRVRESVGQLIGAWHNGDVYCFVARNRDEMRDILIRLGMPGVRLSRHIAGLAIPSRSLLLLNIAPHRDGPVISRTLETFRHEYCHLLMGKFAVQAGAQWPPWFEEGVCQWVQQSGYEPGRAVIAAREGRISLPALAEVSASIDARDAGTSAAYGFSQNAVGFLMRGIPRDDRSGQIARFGERFVANKGDFETSFHETFGESVADFETRWRDHAAASSALDGVWMFVVHHHITLFFAGCGLIMLIGFAFRWRARRRYMKRPETVPPGGPADGLRVVTVLPSGAVVDGERWSPADVDPEGEIARVKRQRHEQHERNRLANLARRARHQSDTRP